MNAYYNEHDAKAAAWLRELIKKGLIADGEVDTRSIELVQPADLAGFVQCHFFAGIGGWSYALRLAGWPDERAVWTGSCPCQPFSAAGKGDGGDDPRHLWPAWFRLIRECRPPVVFGEQVESAIGHGWLDLVCDDLEGEGYAVGAVGLPAACVGAPHIRSRLWLVAESQDADGWREQSAGLSGRGWTGLAGSGADGELADAERRTAERSGCELGAAPSEVESAAPERQRLRDDGRDGGDVDGVADAESRGQRIDWRAPRHAGHVDERESVEWGGHADGEHARQHTLLRAKSEDSIEVGGRSGFEQLGDADQSGPQGRIEHRNGTRERTTGPSGVANAWSDLIYLPCRDGKARPTQSGLQPLAHGVSARVGRLRGYGNAIVPQVAAEFVKAYKDAKTLMFQGA